MIFLSIQYFLRCKLKRLIYKTLAIKLPKIAKGTDTELKLKVANNIEKVQSEFLQKGPVQR